MMNNPRTVYHDLAPPVAAQRLTAILIVLFKGVNFVVAGKQPVSFKPRTKEAEKGALVTAVRSTV